VPVRAVRLELDPAALRLPGQTRPATTVRSAGTVPAAIGPTLVNPRQVLLLQRAAGNQAVTWLVAQGPTVQRCGAETCGGPLEEQLAAAQAATVQRVHLDPSTGRKLFDCDVFASEPKLLACLNDEDRMGPPEASSAVAKVQEGLLKDGMDLGPKGADGRYGGATAKAVRAFKAKHSLGSEQFGDVGPGTMTELDSQCSGQENPTPVPLPDDLIVRFAKSERDGALRVAGNKLRELVDLMDSGIVPVTGNSTATAVATWLLVPPTADGFPDTVGRALKIIDNNRVVQTTITIDRTQSADFARVGAIGDPNSGIVIEDPFFKSNVRCMREVMAHEFFHLSGLVHAYGTTDPEEAINCSHHLAELVFDLATGETGGCSRPPVDDVTPLP